MKKPLNYLASNLLLAFLLGGLLSSCTDTSIIHLNKKKQLYAIDLDYGVSIVPPSDFKRAKSFVGFQAPNRAGSIEVTMESNFEKLKDKYTKESIEARNGKVYRIQPVKYGESENAFYVEFYD